VELKRNQSRTISILLLAAALTVQVSGAASYRKLYNRGLEAIAAKQWQTAASLMLEAIEIQSDADPQLSRTRRGLPYVPHYYFGLALFELGDCYGAVAAWTDSESQGVIKSFDLYQVLVEKKAECERELRQQQALRQAEEDLQKRRRARVATRERLAATAAALSNAEAQKEDPAVEAVWDVTLSAKAEEVRKLLLEASAIVAQEEPVPTLAEIQHAALLVSEAAQRTSTITTQVDERLQHQDQNSEARFSLWRERARSQLARGGALAPLPPGLKALRASLVTILVEADRSVNMSSEVKRGLTERLARATRSFSEAVASPPDWLEGAAEAFVAGRYQDAIALLDEAQADNDRSRAQLLLLRAASCHALDHAADEATPGRDLLKTTKEDIESLLRIEGAPEPSPRLFSPSFIELFKERKAASESPTKQLN
jgi:tetratricopeptide (TPR) repeat protein